MACDCISDCNNKLAEHNACLVTTLFAKPERVAMETVKIDAKKRGKPPYMVAMFCPFCGERYAPRGAPQSLLEGVT